MMVHIDIANSYRYSVLDIVEDLESVLKRKGNYKVIKTNDLYTLDLSVLESFLCTTDLGISLGKDYLIKKLSV